MRASLIRELVQLQSRMKAHLFLLRLIVVALIAYAHHATAQDLPLTKMDEIRHLSVERADENLPVKVRGVITYFDRPSHIAFIQDETGGVYFSPKDTTLNSIDPQGSLVPGTEVEMTGLTIPGGFAPCIGLEIVATPYGPVDFPKPLYPVRSRLVDPKFDSQWIELEATVCDAEIVNRQLLLKIAFDGQQYEAVVTGDWTNKPVPEDLVNSDVRMRGVFGSVYNQQRQLVQMRVFIPSIEFISVIDSGYEQAFAQPSRAIPDVMKFNPKLLGRVRVQGTVLANFSSESIFVRGPGGAIQVQTLSPEPIKPGERVDIVGFPTPGDITPSLKDAVIRPDTSATTKPISLDPIDVQRGRLDGAHLHGELIRTEARVVDHFHRPYDSMIVLESVGGRFYARVPHGGEPLERSSWISLTGICILQPNIGAPNTIVDNAGSADLATQYSMSMIVRSDDDIVVLQLPSWWTPQRIATIAIVLGAILIAAVVWVIMLGQKVRVQTKVIETRIEKQRVAEERARIARELHDTLEQELVGITMQLDHAASRLTSAPVRAQESIDLARAMLRHSQAEARRSVWDLHAPSVSGDYLAKALDEMVAQLSLPDGPVIELSVDDGVSQLRGRFANHILRIAQEALTNAVKHARPTRISIKITSNGDDFRLSVSDDGCGFDIADRPSTADGHFGLSGMQERAGKVHGVLDLDSQPDAGTTLTLTVPIAATNSETLS